MKSRKSYILLVLAILACMYACNITVMGSEGTAFKQSTAGAGAWVAPDGFSDPDNKWNNEANAYDGNLGTYADNGLLRTYRWGSWLHLTFSSPVTGNKLRFYENGDWDRVDMNAIIDGVDTDVFEGWIPDNQYVEKSFSEGSVSQISIRFHNENCVPFILPRVYECAVWRTPVQCKLTVVSGHGSPVPGIGDHNYDDGDSVTCNITSSVIDGNMVWTCTGWSGTGSVPPTGSGTSVAFTITQDSTIMWNWQGTPVQRKLTVYSVNDSPVPGIGDHNYDDGDSVTCNVTSSVAEGGTVWICTGWNGTGSVPAGGSGSSVTFTIIQDSTITWNWQKTFIHSIPEVPLGAVTALIACLVGLGYKRLRQHVH